MERAFLVAGGDRRMIYTAEKLAESRNNQVFITGIPCDCQVTDNVINLKNIPSDSFSVDYLILPAPVSQDGKSLNIPFSEEQIMLSDFLPCIKRGGTVFGGKINDEIKAVFNEREIKAVDYFECEEFNVMNAVPTAEGAVQIALEEMTSVIYGAGVLVTGFGRIAKILIKLLQSFGAKVTVAAGRCSDISWANIYGCRGIDIKFAEKYADEYTLIFNTVPEMVLGRQFIEKVRKDCLIIDLASKPGGVDFTAASENGIKVIWALGLPGKTAPVTAGRIIADTVYSNINERDMLNE